jgi:hypothetical protein
MVGPMAEEREPALFEVGDQRPTVPPVQQSLFGDPQPVRIPAELWKIWLDDERVRARYEAKVYRNPLVPCWFFTGAISDTGHASFRAGSLPGRTRRGTVPGHLYGYQLRYGIIPRLGWSQRSFTGAHTCDEASCQNPDHLRIVDIAENTAEWAERRRNPRGPLADLRGPAGRSRAIATAIRTGIAADEDDEQIAARILAAQRDGLPLTLF